MEFWQAFTSDPAFDNAPPWRDRFAAPMPDGTHLWLPLRDFGEVAVAGPVANQAAFPVVHRIATWMAQAAVPFAAEAVVGLPTLGHVFGPLVAEALGHPNWVAPGYSRKRWYDPALSVRVASITTPGERTLCLDPRLLKRLAGRRVLLVDDVISTGSSAQAGLALLARAGVRPVALCVAMAQGSRWRADWPPEIPVAAAFATPLFRRTSAGWVERPGTAPLDLCPLFSGEAAA